MSARLRAVKIYEVDLATLGNQNPLVSPIAGLSGWSIASGGLPASRQQLVSGQGWQISQQTGDATNFDLSTDNAPGGIIPVTSLIAAAPRVVSPARIAGLRLMVRVAVTGLDSAQKGAFAGFGMFNGGTNSNKWKACSCLFYETPVPHEVMLWWYDCGDPVTSNAGGIAYPTSGGAVEAVLTTILRPSFNAEFSYGTWSSGWPRDEAMTYLASYAGSIGSAITTGSDNQPLSVVLKAAQAGGTGAFVTTFKNLRLDVLLH